WEGLVRDKILTFPAEIARRDLHRFVFFRHGDRPAGVWLVRQGPFYFTLPFTTGPKPGVADYLPAPHGLRGLANSVEQVYPSLVPFIELADGRVLVAGDCADEIEPAGDGQSLRAVWRRWAVVGGKPGELTDGGIATEVTWRLTNKTLTRDEELKVTNGVKVRRWWVVIPTTASTTEVEFKAGSRWDRLKFGESNMRVSVNADWPLT